MFLAVSSMMSCIHDMASDVTSDCLSNLFFMPPLHYVCMCVCAGNPILLAAIVCAHALPDF